MDPKVETLLDGIFLSIDLDYWAHRPDLLGGVERAKMSFRDFYACLLALRIPIPVLSMHDDMLELVNRSRCSQIVNVDFHDDLVVRPDLWKDDLKITEGSWLTFVKDRDKKQLIWCYPCDGSLTRVDVLWRVGRCDEQPLWEEPQRTDWGKITAEKGVETIDWGKVRQSAISLSLRWLSNGPVAEFIFSLLLPSMEPERANAILRNYHAIYR